MLIVGTLNGFSVGIDADDRRLELEAADSFGGASTLEGVEDALSAWAARKGRKVERLPDAEVAAGTLNGAEIKGGPLIRFHVS
jgi:hypothetical protein